MALANLVDQSAEDVVDELKPGTTLFHGQYSISHFLNNGGFGITYLAKDSLNRNVVIKECFAQSICRRTKTLVAARSRGHQGELQSIIRSFVREAHSLSKLKHANIVGVHQVFEENDTAYMVIDFVDGRDLLDIIEDTQAKLQPDQIVDITRKLLSAIKYVHDEGLLHRDISPDNILIDQLGEPILIDFGAASEGSSSTDTKHTALRVVKDGYSPQEFYIAGGEQGPWSDLYALAASLYHLIKGEPPINGQNRLVAMAEKSADPYEPLAGNVEGYPQRFLEAIDKAMASLPVKRQQSAVEWLNMMDNPHGAVNSNAGPDQPLASPRSKGGLLKTVSALAVIVALGVAGYTYLGVSNPAGTTETAQRTVDLVPGPTAEEIAERSAEQEAARVAAEQEATRLAAELEVAKVVAEEEAARVAAEQEADRIATEQKTAQLAAELEAARAAAEQETARLAAELEDARAVSAQEASRVAAEQEAARLAAEQETARIVAEQEETRIAAEQEAARVAAEQDAARVAAEQEATRLAAELEAARLVAVEEAARVAAEQDAARVATEQKAAQLAAELAAARAAAEQETARLAAELEAARTVLAQEATRVTAEQEAARVAAEQEATRLATELEAAKSVAEEEAARVAAEQEAQEADRIATEQKTAQLAAELEAARVAAEQETARLTAELEAARAVPAEEATRVTAEQKVVPIVDEQKTAGIAAAKTSGQVIEATSVMSGASADLPFTVDQSRTTLIQEASVGAPSWLKRGNEIVSVNGIPVESVGDIQRVIKLTSAFKAGDEIDVTFGVKDSTTSNALVRSIRLPIVTDTVLLNGYRFQSRLVDGSWATTVTASSGRGQDEFNIGDVVVAYMATNEKIGAQNTLSSILQREFGKDISHLSFVVHREGEMWVVSMPNPAQGAT